MASSGNSAAGLISRALALVAVAVLVGAVDAMIRQQPIRLTRTVQPQAAADAGLTLQQAKTLHASGVLFLDARGAAAYNRGHIAGAEWMHAAEVFTERAGALFEPLDRDAPIVVYCTGRDCDASKHTAERLAEVGFTDVRVMAPGYDQWIKAFPRLGATGAVEHAPDGDWGKLAHEHAEDEGADAAGDAATAAAGDAGPPPTPSGGKLTLEEARALWEQGAVFLDARTREEFDAGHILLAFWLPFDQVFTAHGAEVLPMIDPSGTVVIYCVGGDCDASEQTAIRLEAELGFTDLRIMGAGYDDWVAAYPDDVQLDDGP